MIVGRCSFRVRVTDNYNYNWYWRYWYGYQSVQYTGVLDGHEAVAGVMSSVGDPRIKEMRSGDSCIGSQGSPAAQTPLQAMHRTSPAELQAVWQAVWQAAWQAVRQQSYLEGATKRKVRRFRDSSTLYGTCKCRMCTASSPGNSSLSPVNVDSRQSDRAASRRNLVAWCSDGVAVIGCVAR